MNRSVRNELDAGRFRTASELVGEALRRLRGAASPRGDGEPTEDGESAHADRRAQTVAAFLAEMESLPVQNPCDGFSSRDHDRVLYGGHR